MAVTIKDVAERVGRSITTVSRALNDYDDVNEETRRRIKQVAKEMGYHPSSIAQKLRKKRTETIGFIMPTFGPRFSDPFFSEFLAGVGNTAVKHGFDLLVSTRAPGNEEMEAYLKNIQSRRVDGFIIVRTRRNDPRIALLQEHNYLFSVFGRTEGENNFPLVDENGTLGMKLVVDHLVEQGHTRIACIAAPANLMFAYYRLKGFLDTLQTHNLSIDDELLLEGDLTQRSGYKLATQLLNLNPPPTAIVACNDLMAIGALSAIQDHALASKSNIAVTGFDDIPWATHTHPPLTTVHQPIYEIGTMVSTMLIQQINGEPFDKQVILQPKLVIRQSSNVLFT